MSETETAQTRLLGIGLATVAALTLSLPAAAQTVTPEVRAAARSLALACRGDIRRLCPRVQPGDGRILRCLDQNTRDLSPACQDALPKARAFRLRRNLGDD